MPQRRKLPDERQSVTQRFIIDGRKFYLTVGLYDDGTPGEIFVKMSKRGSPLHGILDDFAIAVSWGLQYGVPLEKLCEKFIGRTYEPSGRTNIPGIPVASSIVDLIARWLSMKFLQAEVIAERGEQTKVG